MGDLHVLKYESVGRGLSPCVHKVILGLGTWGACTRGEPCGYAQVQIRDMSAAASQGLSPLARHLL